MKKSFIFFLVLFLPCTAGCAQEMENPPQMIKDLEALSSDAMEGRATGSRGAERARSYLLGRFEELGLRACGDRFEQPFAVNESIQGVNLIARIEGSKSPGIHIVVSAHYDHLGIRRGSIYNGADDNASGTAALLAVSEHFLKNPPLHSLIVAAFDAEEMGLVGARSFVQSPCVPLESIAININMDMISRSSSHELFASGTRLYPYLRQYVEGMDQDRAFSLHFGHDSPETGADNWTFSSDHAPFHAAGIPFIYFGVEDHDGYHQPNDDFEDVTVDFYIAVVGGIIESISKIDTSIEDIQAHRSE